MACRIERRRVRRSGRRVNVAADIVAYVHITYKLNKARCLPRDRDGLGLGHIFDGRALDTASVCIPVVMQTVLARSKHAELIGGLVEFHVQLASSDPPWFQKGFRGAFHVLSIVRSVNVIETVPLLAEHSHGCVTRRCY